MKRYDSESDKKLLETPDLDKYVFCRVLTDCGQVGKIFLYKRGAGERCTRVCVCVCVWGGGVCVEWTRGENVAQTQWQACVW